jgi:hypothetical protein
MTDRALTVLVSGMVAGVPFQGGATWAVLQYLIGLRRLGHDIAFVEPVTPPPGVKLAASSSAAYCRDAMAAAGLDGRWALLESGTTNTAGMGYDDLRRVAAQADLLLNIAGALTDEALLGPIPVRVYVDLDPAFTQLWQEAEGIDMRFDGHTHFVTVGLSVGQADCAVPTCGREWITTLPPVVLGEWPTAGKVAYDAFTTVANWRGYGSVEYRGVFHGQKAHSLRPLIDLPSRTGEHFVLALAIDPGEERDLTALRANGWELLEPTSVAGTPNAYRRFVQGSKAEFGIAKSGYVVSRSGWFSDRSACYLASGRPAIAQDTGFARHLPTGEGLFCFSTIGDVASAIGRINRDYGRHSRAARAIAVEHFDSDRVLNQLLDRLRSPWRSP